MRSDEAKISAFFCEDVRQELGGKISAMGILHGFLGMQNPDIPMVKLVALTIMSLPVAICTGSVAISVAERDAQVTPPVKIELDSLSPAPGSPDLGVRSLVVPIELVGFELKTGMRLSIRVSINDSSTWISDELVVVSARHDSQVVQSPQ